MRMTEIDRLARLLAKCPSLAKTFASEQTTFDDEAEPTADDLLFVTRVPGTPRAGWHMANYVVSHTSRRREAAEAAVADLTERKILALARCRSPRRWSGPPPSADRKLHPQRRSARGLQTAA
jgi:hypothetical protein